MQLNLYVHRIISFIHNYIQLHRPLHTYIHTYIHLYMYTFEFCIYMYIHVTLHLQLCFFFVQQLDIRNTNTSLHANIHAFFLHAYIQKVRHLLTYMQTFKHACIPAHVCADINKPACMLTFPKPCAWARLING